MVKGQKQTDKKGGEEFGHLGMVLATIKLAF
jgi:hypothetical protein